MKSERIKFIEELHTLIRKYRVDLSGESLIVKFTDFERERSEGNCFSLEFFYDKSLYETQEWSFKIVVKDAHSRDVLKIT